MKLKKIYIMYTALSLSVISCTKKIEVPASNESVFRAYGEFNGSDFEIIAGDDNAYMHTLTDEENGVSVFSGKLTSANLDIEIGVFNGDIDFFENGAELTEITPVFASTHSEALTVLSKNSFDNYQNINSIDWYIDDELAGVNNVFIYEPGIYNVCAMIHFSNGTENTICNELILGYSAHANCSIETTILSNGAINCTPVGSTSPISNIKWYLNGEFIQDSLAWDWYVGSESKTITAEVHFENGVVKRKSFLVNGYSDAFTVSDFTVFENTQSSFIPQDFNVRVKVKQGSNVYNSTWAKNEEASLSISAIDYYGLNNQGNNVYKIIGNIDCFTRKAGSSVDVNLKMDVVFGIEVPQ